MWRLIPTRVHDVDPKQQLNLRRVASDLSAQADHLNARSGFILDRITKFILCIFQYRPLHGFSFVFTPQWLAKKQAVINVKNTSDSKSFVWSVLAALYPGARNPNRLSNYKPYENTLDILGFILPVKDKPKFEKQNPSISVNVLCSGDERGYVPLYVSKERDHSHHVNLFLLEERNDIHHYV